MFSQTDHPKFDYQEFDRKMKESQLQIDVIKKSMQKVNKSGVEKKLAVKISKAKGAIVLNADQHLVNELKNRK